jgi:LAS superfamily LD-carboxypeptidase LdcB
MVRVPEYTPNVSLRPNLRQNIDVRATPESFGADVGRGVQSVARGVEMAGNVVAELQAVEDATRAKEADNAYSNWMRERMYGEGGYMTLEGRNALDARAAFEREADEKRKEFGKGLTGQAALSYQNASTARLQSAKQQAIVHGANERKGWIKQTSAARIETFANDALVNYDSPALVTKNIAAGLLEMRERGKLEGWSADALAKQERDFVSGVHKNVALRLAQDDPIAAEQYVKDHKDALSGADSYAVTKTLETEIKNEKAKREADAILQASRDPSSKPSVGGDDPANGARATDARTFLRERLTAGHGRSHVDGLDETFATNLAAMIQDAPPEIRDGLGILSGYRSVERQRELYADALKKYGSPSKARRWVAPPGRSNHNHGQAVDLAYNGQSLAHAPKEVVDWVHANARKYNLFFPMAHEPWHVEPAGARSGTVAPRSQYVAARAAMPSYDEIERRLSNISDPDVRDIARRRVFTAIEVQSKAAEQNERAAKAELWKYIDQGLTPDDVPMDVRQAAGMSAVSSAWNYLETAAKGRDVTSDEVLLYQMRRYSATNPLEFANIDLNEYRDRLSKQDIRSLTEAQTSVLADSGKARRDNLNLTAAFSQASQQLEAVGITTAGKKGSEREEAALRVARFQNALAEEMEAFKREKKQEPTQVDVQSMINKLLLPAVIKTPGWLWGTNETQARAFELGNRPDASTAEIAVEYTDIPLDLRRGIAIDLENELGRKPSDEEVVERYEQFILNR